MTLPFSGIEKRLEKLKKCLIKLEPLQEKLLSEFESDPYLKDIVERNLEVAAQCCIDIANRIISLEGFDKPNDAYEAIVRLGEQNIIPLDFAQQFAPITGFRNILIHEYLDIDWNEVYDNLRSLKDFNVFIEHVKRWLLTKIE